MAEGERGKEKGESDGRDKLEKGKSRLPSRSDWGLDEGITPASMGVAVLKVIVGWFRVRK